MGNLWRVLLLGNHLKSGEERALQGKNVITCNALYCKDGPANDASLNIDPLSQTQRKS